MVISCRQVTINAGETMMQSGFWWLLLVVAFYALLHSLLASLAAKRWVSDRLGNALYQRYYRLFFSLQAFILFLPVLLLAWLLPDGTIYRIPAPWVYMTLLLQLGAAWLLIDSINQTGALRFIGFAQALKLEPATKRLPLVERGMYRYVRHPIYTNIFVIMWLMPFMTWNLLALAIGVNLYNVIGAQLEERKLLQEFGEAYNQYRRKTPFMVPLLKLGKLFRK